MLAHGTGKNKDEHLTVVTQTRRNHRLYGCAGGYTETDRPAIAFNEALCFLYGLCPRLAQ